MGIFSRKPFGYKTGSYQAFKQSEYTGMQREIIPFAFQHIKYNHPAET